MVIEKPAAAAAAKPKTAKAKATNLSAEVVVPEETALERRHREERMQRESDLDSALGLFGIDKKTINMDEVLGSTTSAPSKPSASKNSLSTADDDGSVPSTQAEFDALASQLLRRLERSADHKLYPQFLESLFRGLMQSREAPEVRKLAGILNDLATNKQKERLIANKKKPAASLAGAAKKGSRMDYADYGGGEYDDFE